MHFVTSQNKLPRVKATSTTTEAYAGEKVVKIAIFASRFQHRVIIVTWLDSCSVQICGRTELIYLTSVTSLVVALYACYGPLTRRGRISSKNPNQCWRDQNEPTLFTRCRSRLRKMHSRFGGFLHKRPNSKPREESGR
ncbi:unnamed protein product [Clavelina lepadiformis]|uniref:Uncharacterized protein n=1 Tax=Clavelina lepadiformis TaxID=159417 RepID=A0ABP0G0E5_CLALP